MCGYDLNLTYPQEGNFPTLTNRALLPPNTGLSRSLVRGSDLHMKSKSWKDVIAAKYYAKGAGLDRRELELERREERRQMWKRDLTGRANGTIDPWYQCYLFEEMTDYAVNFSFPWSKSQSIPGYPHAI